MALQRFQTKKNIKFALYLIFVGALIISSLSPISSVKAISLQQEESPNQKALQLLTGMTPEERIGQLFLISMKGRDTSSNTQIFDLITNHHIGGVVLKTANDNFTGPENTIIESYKLISGLQKMEFSASELINTSPTDNSSSNQNAIPLFIAISQEGDSYPNDQILNGMTVLPNLMAIGGTWDIDLSRSIGTILGDELGAIGFNLLLGPSLDVLDIVTTEKSEDLGTRTFGGDPYWVGELGRAYIEGVHTGSENRVAVIAKHFPGRGGSDRQPDKEVATVRKSLEQLKQIELAPFIAVSGKASSLESKTDGLLISHTRYQGFQGNIRATTRPVSFDQSALDLLMSDPDLQSWYEGKGILVSDDLGSQAVRKFYDPTGITFNGRQVARDAFLAGNDLLYLNNFQASGDQDEYTTILRTLEFFTQKYAEDPAFSKKVDKSVERILTVKFSLYPEFTLENVLPDQNNLDRVGKSSDLVMEVAQSAATLISPELSELYNNIPVPPALKDQIVFITDELSARQCSQCNLQEIFPVDGLERAVLRLYGPASGGQVVNYKLSSYSNSELLAYLNNSSEVNPTIAADISSAMWIVFSLRTIEDNRPESQVFKRFLNDRPDLYQNKQVIAFAFNAPYYLDATDISKLTAYYGLYSQSPMFLDVAARLLFQEFLGTGSLPVNVTGIGYDLITATSPEPNQIIPLSVELPSGDFVSEVGPQETPTAAPSPIPTLSAGESIQINTGIIYDHNNHQVPDGTVVRFWFNYQGDEGADQSMDAVTLNGIAQVRYELRPFGLLEIRATSDPAFSSELIQLEISSGEVVSLEELPPPPAATETMTPTETATALPQPTATEMPPVEPEESSGLGGWTISMLITWLGAALIYLRGKTGISTRWGIRFGLLAASGGVISYLTLQLIDPSWSETLFTAGSWQKLVWILLGLFVGWFSGWIWYRWR